MAAAALAAHPRAVARYTPCRCGCEPDLWERIPRPACRRTPAKLIGPHRSTTTSGQSAIAKVMRTRLQNASERIFPLSRRLSSEDPQRREVIENALDVRRKY